MLVCFVMYNGLFQLLLTHDVFSLMVVFLIYLSITSMSIQRTKKQLKSPVHTLFLSVSILCLLLLAAGSSPSGAGPGMFISFLSNMGMLGAAGGCSNRSEGPCSH